MADFALFRMPHRALFSFSTGCDRLILFSFSLFMIFGQFFRLIPLSFFPSHFSLAEVLLYALTIPFYFCGLRKSMWLLCFISLSTLYGAVMHGVDFVSLFYSVKLQSMIVSGVVVGEILFRKYSIDQGLDFFLKIFSLIVFLGMGIFFFFPKAQLFFSFLDHWGIHFYGDPHQRRFISPFLDPNYYGAIACIPLLLTIVRGRKWLFLLIVSSIFLTFSRSGILTCLLLLIFQIRKLPLLFILGVLISCFYFEEIKIFAERLLYFAGDASALSRLDTFETVLQWFWKSPFFGLGYHYLSPLFFLECGRHCPDSSLLIILIDFGLIPTILFGFYGIYWSIQKFHKKQPLLFFWLYIYLVISIFFTSFFNHLLFYPYWLIPMIALFTFLNRIQNANSTRS